MHAPGGVGGGTPTGASEENTQHSTELELVCDYVQSITRPKYDLQRTRISVNGKFLTQERAKHSELGN